jgi:hypothetical protein
VSGSGAGGFRRCAGVEVVAVIAVGELDAWSGRSVRAGQDDLDTLRRATPEGTARQLRLRPYGDDDPTA